MVYQLTKFHVQRVDMVINPPWNLPFLGAKGLTSPEQTATGKGISNPFMAVMVCQKPYGIQLTNVSSTETLKNSCCKDKKRRLEVLQIKNNLKNSIYNILRKLKVFKVKIKNVLKELEVHNTKLSLANSNSYLRDILGDILGKDMYYPLTFVKPIRVSLVYKRNPKAQCYVRVVQIVMWIVDSGCSKHMAGDHTLLETFVKKFMDIAASLPVCLMSKATSTKPWLWPHRLLHLNFGTINDLTKHDLVDGFLKFKYSKDHLCSTCEQGKSNKSSHQPKLVPRTHSKLELLHMDLCGPMRAETINEKKYILVIVDDYS
ncbi:integrase, catalytic region, zinc finger, CCHC-type containing protein [Tanacetum coccineum]